MTKEEIVDAVTRRVSGQMSASEVSSLVASAMRDFPAQAPHADLPQAQEVVTETVIDNVSSEMPSGEEPRETEEQEQPCCFLCQYDYDLGELTIRDPIVVLPDGTVGVPEVPTLSSGNTYYCVVTREDATYGVKITGDPGDVEGDVITSVPICKIDNDGGFVTVRQYHVGAIILSGGSGRFKCSFAAVISDDGSTADLFEPLVVTPNGEVNVDGATGLGAGTYWCHVKKDSEGTYTAEVSESASPSSGYDDSVMDVKICKLEADDDGNLSVEQYHVGAIVVSPMTKLTGDADGSVGVDKDVSVTGTSDDGSSGIEFKTEAKSEGNPAKLVAKIKGKPSGENWESREMTVVDSEGVETKIHFLASEDITVHEGGGGGSDELEVLTGFNLRYDANTHYIEVEFSKKKLKNVSFDDVTTDWETTGLQFEEVEVPTDIKYDTDTVKFTQKPSTLHVLRSEPATKEETVFTAVPHSGNSPAPNIPTLTIMGNET